MQERIRNIPRQILEWWNKFSVKQKTIMASITLAVIVGLVIVVKIMTTPTMVPIRNCANTKEAGQVKELLEGSDINYEVSNDGLNFSVKSEDEANAAILLGENGIPAIQRQIRVRNISFIFRMSWRRIWKSLILWRALPSS